jgi:hypothetical protein
MTATFFIPAHPCYFNDEFSQEESDAALGAWDKAFCGILKGQTELPVEHKCVLLREPSKDVTLPKIFRTNSHDLQLGLRQPFKCAPLT